MSSFYHRAVAVLADEENCIRRNAGTVFQYRSGINHGISWCVGGIECQTRFKTVDWLQCICTASPLFFGIADAAGGSLSWLSWTACLVLNKDVFGYVKRC